MNHTEHEHDIEEYVFVDINNIKAVLGREEENKSTSNDDESFDLCDEELCDDLSQCPSASASLCSENLFQITENSDSLKEVRFTNKNVQVSSSQAQSRLSNKKRRKQIKRMKKAEAAAFAAAALANRASKMNSEETRLPKKKALPSTKVCKNIAVLCATQSYAEFRDGCQVRS